MLRPAPRIALAVPVIFLILAATAIPIEFRSLGEAQMVFEVSDVPDIVTNVIGYVPLGIVLGELGLLRAVFIAGLISTFAETGQLVLMHRDPSFTDIVSNVAGAALGSLASARWKIRSPALPINRWAGALAVLLSFALVLYVRSIAGEPVNTRGATTPGTLEADWRLDQEAAERSWIPPGTHWLASSARSRSACRA